MLTQQIFQVFHFQKPIKIETSLPGFGDAIIATRNKTTIKIDLEDENKGMAEILSKVKLAETDPLLVTYFFQKNLTAKERNYTEMFIDLIQPLTDAWTYKTLRLTSPTLYQTQMFEIYAFQERLHKKILANQKDNTSKWHREMISVWSILQENPHNNIRLKLTTPEQYYKGWENYVNLLKDNIPENPSVQLYLDMVVKTNADFTVNIETDKENERYFNVRGRNKNRAYPLSLTEESHKKGEN